MTTSGTADAYAPSLEETVSVAQPTRFWWELFIVLWLYARKPRPRLAVSGVFALGYGCARFFTEYFRIPDYEVHFAGVTISAGQMLSVPMIVFYEISILIGRLMQRRSRRVAT